MLLQLFELKISKEEVIIEVFSMDINDSQKKQLVEIKNKLQIQMNQEVLAKKKKALEKAITQLESYIEGKADNYPDLISFGYNLGEILGFGNGQRINPNEIKDLMEDLKSKADNYILEWNKKIEDLPLDDKNVYHEIKLNLRKEIEFRIKNYLRLAEQTEKEEEKKQYYERVLALDNGNFVASEGLRLIQNKRAQAQIQSTKQRLAELKNLRALQELIDELKILKANGTLSPELQAPLFEAEKRLESMKIEAGIISSAIRTGNLKEKYHAIELLEKSGSSTAPHPITQTEVPLSDVIEIARTAWLEASREAMNKIFNHISPYKESNPKLALQYLELTIGEPGERNKELVYYHEDQRREYEKLYYEIKNLKEKQDIAESYIKKADEINDPLEKYKNLKKAFDNFKNFESLQDRISSIYPQALSSLSTTIDLNIQFSREAITLRDFDREHGAPSFISKAFNLLNEWPGDQKDILSIKNKLDQARQEIDNNILLFQKLITLEKQIREQVQNRQTLEQAFSLFQEEIYGKEDIKKLYPEIIKRISAFLDLYRSVDEQIDLINKYLNEETPDYENIKELCNKVIESIEPESSHYKKVKEILNNVDAEILKKEIQQDINNENIKEAKQKLIKFKDRYPEYINTDWVLEKEKLFSRVEENSKPFLPFIKLAKQKEKSSNVLDKYLALRIYRYLSGDINSKADSIELPDYDLNVYTFDAKKAVVNLERTLRQDLDRIKEAMNSNNLHNIEELALCAKSLKELNLVYSDDENRLCEWAEVASTQIIANQNETINKFEDNIDLWRDIKSRYYAIGSQKELEATIKALIQKAKLSIIKDPRMAIQELEDLRESYILQAPEYRLALSEAYEKAHNLDKAYQIVNIITDNEKIKQRKTDLEIRLEINKINDKIKPYKEVFEQQTQGYCQQLQNLNECVKQISLSVNEIKKIYLDAEDHNDILSKDESFKQIIQNDFEYIKTKLLQIIRKLWDQNTEQTDLQALLLSLIYHEISAYRDLSSERITVETLQQILYDSSNSRRINAAIISGKDEIERHIMNLSGEGYSLQSTLQYAELLFWQTNVIEKLIRDLGLGIEIDNLVKEEISRGRYSLQVAYHSLEVLSVETLWEMSTEQVEEKPIANHIKNFGHDIVRDTYDARNVKRKFLEWQIIITYFGLIKNEIEQLNANENWEEILQTIKLSEQYIQVITLESEPSRQESIRQKNEGIPFTFTQVKSDEYDKFHKWYGRNIWVYHFNQGYQGWDKIKEYANECLEDYREWYQWGEHLQDDIDWWQNAREFINTNINRDFQLPLDCNSLDFSSRFPLHVEELILHSTLNYQSWVKADLKQPQEITTPKNEKIYAYVTRATRDKDSVLPYRYRIWILDAYREQLCKIEEYYQSGPYGKSINDSPIKSINAKQIKDNADRIISDIRSSIKYIEDKEKQYDAEIKKRGGFISRDEVPQNKNEWIKLKERVNNAHLIGPSSREEWDILYPVVLWLDKENEPDQIWEKIYKWVKDQFGWV
jgi:hypothetical protein